MTRRGHRFSIWRRAGEVVEIKIGQPLRLLCRLWPLPRPLLRTLAHLAQPTPKHLDPSASHTRARSGGQNQPRNGALGGEGGAEALLHPRFPPFLKLEKENFDAKGSRQQLNFYGISAKLYCLFNLEGKRLLVRKPSGHGLGFLQAPYTIADWQRRTGRKWNEDLPPWIYEAWHFVLSRELGLPQRPPAWLKQPATMAVPITTPQVLSRLGVLTDDLRPFTVMTVPFPKRETVSDPLRTGYFIMPHTEKLNDLQGRTMVNIVSGEAFHIYDKYSSKLPKPPGWLALGTMEDEIDRILSRAESKFCTPNGGVCTSKTVGLLVRRHIVAGEFHFIGKEASTRWAGGVDLSMMPEAGILDQADETCREYERVVDPKYLDQIRTRANKFSNKGLSRQSGVARSAIMNFKKGRNTLKPRTLRKLLKAIHDLQNKGMKN